MKIAIGSDHAGLGYKQRIIEHLKEKGREVVDFGTHSADSTDYLLWIIPTAEAAAKGEAERGIVLADRATAKPSIARVVFPKTLQANVPFALRVRKEHLSSAIWEKVLEFRRRLI